MKQKHSKLSKFLSYILRHKPESINLQLNSQGWANVDELVHLANLNGKGLSHTLLREIVKSSDKQRFILSEDGKFIRANQGHSIEVDLELKPQTPPEHLYHGTAEKYLKSILSQGLKKQNRQYVHLSFEKETAKTVGRRHGKVVVLIIAAQDMHRNGYCFYLSENNVWLTNCVPKEYLRVS